MISCCGYCPHNGDAILTTYPPKIRCELTGKLHYTKDSCDVYDIVAVVRCQNCDYAKHWYGDKAKCFLWSENGIDVFEDGYCNYGKRKEDAETN